MSHQSFDSINLQKCLERWRNGDSDAANDLLRGTGPRLEKLARRMTRSFPNVRAQTETGDVLQNSTLRLLHTLRKLNPKTTRDFYNLAAVHIRRELLDLARHYKRRTCLSYDVPDLDGACFEPATELAPDFDLWVRFHEAVDALPTSEREVVGLVFYHDWTQERIAELFGVDERTIRRRWHRARERLRQMIGDDRV